VDGPRHHDDGPRGEPADRRDGAAPPAVESPRPATRALHDFAAGGPFRESEPAHRGGTLGRGVSRRPARRLRGGPRAGDPALPSLGRGFRERRDCGNRRRDRAVLLARRLLAGLPGQREGAEGPASGRDPPAPVRRAIRRRGRGRGRNTAVGDRRDDLRCVRILLAGDPPRPIRRRAPAGHDTGGEQGRGGPHLPPAPARRQGPAVHDAVRERHVVR